VLKEGGMGILLKLRKRLKREKTISEMGVAMARINTAPRKKTHQQEGKIGRGSGKNRRRGVRPPAGAIFGGRNEKKN